MNILVLALESLADEISGVGQTTLSLSKAWLDAGHKVSLMIPQNLPDYLVMKNTFHDANVLGVVKTPAKRSIPSVTFLYLQRLLQSAKYNFKLTLTMNIDYVFTDSNISLFATYVVSKMNSFRYRRKPVVIIPFYHITPRSSAYKKNFIKNLEHMSLTIALTFANKYLNPCYFTESTFTAKTLSEDFLVPKEKILVLGGGIDDCLIEKMLQMNYSPKHFDACFIGRIHPAKGIFDLVNAWRTVKSNFPDAKLAIIGGGYPQYRKMIEKLIVELHLENNVELCGQVSDGEKFKILSQSKFLVHPAYEECIPLTFFEAASANLPIITYYLPTYENVAECLIPVKTGDVVQLAAVLVKCLSEYATDKKTFYPLIEKENELAKKHTWKNIAKLLLSQSCGGKCANINSTT